MLPKTVFSRYSNTYAKKSWDFRTAAFAAYDGHLHILEYLVERKYDKFEAFACERAAGKQHKAPWDSEAKLKAHENNHPECVQYLLDNNCLLPDGWRYEHGELHTL